MKMMTKLKRYTCSALVAVAGTAATLSTNASDGLVVHEWGTFTSVQGGDGNLLLWQANITGDLPDFVYNWMKPDLNRQATLDLLFGKGGLSTLQRMETPVIYFYSDKDITADVTVRFPKGKVTEWYPQAGLIGPANVQNTNLTTTHVAKDSVVRWPDVRVLSKKSSTAVSDKMPRDKNGTHYFAARETEAALLRVNNQSSPKPADEYEKFLFYRGSGNFGTPLKVTTDDAGLVSVENTGKIALRHLYLMNVHNGMAEWVRMETLKPGVRQSWEQFDSIKENRSVPLAEFKRNAGSAMVDALTDFGLYRAEAKAMVNTWTKAWFGEEGVRVLYVLPRNWTDETLPMDLKPKPHELVRVMVGRSEIIPPQTQKVVAQQLKRFDKGDVEAKKWIQDYQTRFGRFAPPAFQLARKLNAPSEQPENKAVATASTP